MLPLFWTLVLWSLLSLAAVGLGWPPAALAAPGICVGPVCADSHSRSSVYPWQVRLRLSDQRGQQERLTVDCRNGQLSPREGPVDRSYGAAVARRVCRLA